MRAYELIEKPENWTQWTFARSSDGIPVLWDDENAFAFSAIGAIYKAYLPPFLGEAIRKLRKDLGHERISGWNNSRTHAEVYETLKRLGI